MQKHAKALVQGSMARNASTDEIATLCEGLRSSAATSNASGGADPCPSCTRPRFVPRDVAAHQHEMPGCTSFNLWTSLRPKSPLALQIAASQARCAEQVAVTGMNSFGMGSDFQTWTLKLCKAVEQGKVLVTQGYWIWTDKSRCDELRHRPPLHCYFDKLPRLPRRECASPPSHRANWSARLFEYSCPSLVDDASSASRQAFQAAAAEYLMASLSPWLVQLASMDASTSVFGPAGPPADMITCHIRWGDKDSEMELVDISSYVRAVSKLVRRHALTQPVSIYVTTEDPHALEAFIAAAAGYPWRVLNYAPSVSKRRSRHGPANDAMATRGRAGTQSIIALLLALNARYYVLSTASTWSRLINNIRLRVVDRECNGCTDMVDLRPCDALNLSSSIACA